MLEKYLAAHTDALPKLCMDLLEETERKTGRAHWSIGKVEGRFLQMIVRLSRTRQAVEVGTFTGLSALMIAAALPPDGCPVTCEIDPQVAEIARRYFAKSPLGHKKSVWSWGRPLTHCGKWRRAEQTLSS